MFLSIRNSSVGITTGLTADVRHMNLKNAEFGQEKYRLRYFAFHVSRSIVRQPCFSPRCHISSRRSFWNQEYIPNPFLYLLQLAYLLIGETFIGFLTSKTFNVAMKCGWLGLSLSSLLASTLS